MSSRMTFAGNGIEPTTTPDIDMPWWTDIGGMTDRRMSTERSFKPSKL
jgi:hypothetical protein